MLGLATTLPLAFLRPAPAAVAVSAASLLSLGLFHFLTAGRRGHALVAAYQFGRGTGAAASPAGTPRSMPRSG